ncbi:MAG TPA: adenine deaminase C-terminal domain-containing protein, partial [Verrucomicrobiae bacterium]|nr:adenine deaminase C-terminal domain-containing protein [Verrucomicrobiae bacterium]
DLASEGHIDHCVRKAIEAGVPPVTAVQMGSINTARHYRLKNFGAVAPRFWADFIVCDDLREFRVRQTYKKGVLVAEDGKYVGALPVTTPQPRSTMNLSYDPQTSFRAPIQKPGRIRIIEIVPNQIITKEIIETAPTADGEVVSDPGRDILKLVVVERHQATGNVGVGFVRGFKLKRGALASTVAHDAHNVVAVGVNDTEIARAIQELERMKGGQAAVAGGEVKAALPLPIAGLVSDRPLEEVIRRTQEINRAAAELGCDLAAPFMTLSFLSLSPIPELKLTDQGLIDATHLRKTSLFVD